jgi:hypothetical protein
MSDESNQSNQLKIAIIVPYRDLHSAQKRAEHLKQFIDYMGPFMEKAINQFGSNTKFHIFIIEQSPEHKFNRGALLNIGFVEASKKGYNVFIFHDVDLLPGDSIAPYYVKNPEIPIHIARCWKRYKGKEYLGGIISISGKNYTDINGYPNNYWGWGGEDDELRRRVNELNLEIENPKEEDCEITDLEGMDLEEKLKLLRKNESWKNMKKNELKDEHSSTWQSNGVNSIEGEYTDFKDEKINDYTTKISVELINLEPEEEEDVERIPVPSSSSLEVIEDKKDKKDELPPPKKNQQGLLSKKKGNIISSVYSRGLITRNIVLKITNIGKNIKETLENSIIFNFEGKCLVEGFIKPNSCKIITYSSGLIERGNQISFEVIFECDICFPVEGTKITCIAKNITKAGIRAESAVDLPSPIVVFIARDHHYNIADFGSIKEDDKITVRVIGQRFELNDKFISIIGEFVKEKPDYKKVKKSEAKARLVFEE